jgi:hypothetical protein
MPSDGGVHSVRGSEDYDDVRSDDNKIHSNVRNEMMTRL